MKYFIFLFIILISLPLLAQIKTGTGGKKDNDHQLVDEQDNPGTKINNQDINLFNFTKTLSLQEIRCRSTGNSYLSLKDTDFMQTYLQLSVLHNSFVADDKCSDLNAYFKCLNSKHVKDELQLVLQDKKMKKHLQNKYKIKEEQAEKILEFFRNFDQGCPSGECKM